MSAAGQPSAGELFFLDTNVFVYALLASEPLKKQRALQLIEQALASHLGCISYQVIQEFANVATRKFAQRFSTEQCKQFIDAAMQPMNRVSSSPELLSTALDLQQETHYSFTIAWYWQPPCRRALKCCTAKTCSTTSWSAARCALSIRF